MKEKSNFIVTISASKEIMNSEQVSDENTFIQLKLKTFLVRLNG